MSIVQSSGPSAFRAGGGGGPRAANGSRSGGARRAGPSAQRFAPNAPTEAEDPVGSGLRASARRIGGIAVFSGVINILTLAGSIYMLQVYDRVIRSRNIAT